MTASESTGGEPAGRVGDWATYRRLLRYVKPHWFLFLLAVLGFQLGSAAEAYFVSLFGNLIDSWPQAALSVPLLMLSAAAVRGVGEVVGELLLSRISFTVVHRLRTELFEQLLTMPSGYFDASAQGHLVSRITYNVAQLRDTGTDALKTIVQDGGKLFVYLAFMIYLSWQLTLIFAATAPLVALVVVLASSRFRRVSQRIQHSMGDVTHVAAEAVSGYRVMRIFGGEDYERRRFERSSLSNRRQNLKMVRTKVVSTQLIQVFVAAALTVLIVLLLQPEVGGHLSIGDVVAFLGLAGMLARPIKKLSEVNARLQRGLAAADDVFAQLDQPSEQDGGELTVARARGELSFRHVRFTYDAASGAVLDDINLEIEPGQTVALVGRSGSGKSTLASLIPRFYEPDSGQILLDGVPLSDYRLSALRSQVALVSQDVTLFNDTLRRNIAYGALEEAGEAALADAVQRAHADVFINEMPQGLETVVGDDGVLLSGGQRQRVAIARALLKDAPVLILDEATSALDSASERYIQAALEAVMEGRTTIVIAHRLSTIERADVIVVMDRGRIVEQGDHASLLAANGAYAELYGARFQDDAADTAATAAVARLPVRRPRLAAAERKLGPLARAWYSGAWWPRLLTPLAWLFATLSRRRRLRYLTGKRTAWRAPLPVIVVGNITAGGTGKTPLVIWLADKLTAIGHRPGIVLRGHGGAKVRKPLRVSADTTTAQAGDEACLLARRTGVPVVACADRCAAVRLLVEETDCDIVLSDDGLQHYALVRDLEIVVVDGERGVGNGLRLPAGPLREPVERLTEADWVVSSSEENSLWPDATVMRVRPLRFVPLGHTARPLAPAEFANRFENVNAVAGIGNPQRFLRTLRDLGLDAMLTAYPDHHVFSGAELSFDNEWPVVVTEKDAVKIAEVEAIAENVWYLEIDVDLEPVAGEGAAAKLGALLRAHGVHTR